MMPFLVGLFVLCYLTFEISNMFLNKKFASFCTVDSLGDISTTIYRDNKRKVLLKLEELIQNFNTESTEDLVRLNMLVEEMNREHNYQTAIGCFLNVYRDNNK